MPSSPSPTDANVNVIVFIWGVPLGKEYCCSHEANTLSQLESNLLQYSRKIANSQLNIVPPLGIIDHCVCSSHVFEGCLALKRQIRIKRGRVIGVITKKR